MALLYTAEHLRISGVSSLEIWKALSKHAFDPHITLNKKAGGSVCY